MGGSSDLDFFIGEWRVDNRRLKTLFAGADDWDDFSGTAVAYKVMAGAGLVDEMHLPARDIDGMSLHLFDPASGDWSSYWVNAADGRLQPPTTGRFADGRGDFRGSDTHDGRPIAVHYVWSAITPSSFRWEQAFSADRGRSFETNWIMDFTRTA